VLKLWHAADPLPPHAAAGYKSLTITGPDTSAPRTMSDPDGNQLLFVPSGHNQVDQIEFQVGVSDVALFDRFYGDILGVERIGDGRYRLGRTILAVSADSGARQVKTEPLTNPLDAVAAMSGIGFRYLTIQVRDGAAEYPRVIGKGVNPGVAPVTGAGPVATPTATGSRSCSAGRSTTMHGLAPREVRRPREAPPSRLPEFYGDILAWSSDVYHHDGDDAWQAIETMRKCDLSESCQARFLGDNAAIRSSTTSGSRAATPLLLDSPAPQQDNVLVAGQVIAPSISEVAADVFLHPATCDCFPPVRIIAEKKPR